MRCSMQQSSGETLVPTQSGLVNGSARRADWSDGDYFIRRLAQSRLLSTRDRLSPSP